MPRLDLGSIRRGCLDDDSGLYDHRNVAQNSDIHERISSNRDEISDSAGRDGADVGYQFHVFCGDRGG